MHGVNSVKSYTSTQSVLATSSGESEFYNIIRATAQGLGMKSMSADCGLDMSLVVLADATAGMGIAQRRGLGRVRHLHTQYLWVQQIFSQGRAKIKKEPRASNQADMMTHYCDAATIKRFMAAMGQEFREGESEIALQVEGPQTEGYKEDEDAQISGG